MERTDAALVLVLVSLMLAVLILSEKIAPTIAGGTFAVALALLGVLSRGFRKSSQS